MTPLGALSTLLASLLLAATVVAGADEEEAFSASASSFIPALDQFSTVYTSTQSSAGFMFDIKAKNAMSVFGLDVNLVPPSIIRGGPETRVVVYTKEGTFKGHERDESAWEPWIDATVESYGLDEPTPIPQRDEDAARPLFVPSREKRAFYVAFEGPYLRYHTDADKWYYINRDVIIYGNGAAKRKGWGGGSLSPRTFNGGLHYYVGERELDLPVQLLPEGIVSQSPTERPTRRPTAYPTVSMEPTATTMPTPGPTGSPTESPTPGPSRSPTARPIDHDMFATRFEDAETKPVLVYAGSMFDLKGRDDIEIQKIAFNTYLTREMEVQLYIREGGYSGAEEDIDQWTLRASITVTGQGMGRPTYFPVGSFEPVLVRKQQKMGFYIATDGPYIRATKGNMEGKPHAANKDVVIYQGVGKRHPITSGTVPARIFNGAFGYYKVDIPTPSPTINTGDLFVRNATFNAVEDTYIMKDVRGSTFGRKAQLKVDGSPESVALMKFDMSVLNGNTRDEPDQILSAVLRLYSMTESDFGGYVSIIPDGDINEDRTTWHNSPYAEDDLGIPVGEFRWIWPNKFYEMDITHAFRGRIPKTFLIRISSDRNNGVMYRSSVGAQGNGPQIAVKFAYEPDTNKALAKMFGSDPPTPAPTQRPTIPEWENHKTPSNPGRTYFNYNPRSSWGPERWNRVAPDGYYDRLNKLKTDTGRNKCGDGRRQSPRNLCRTSDACLEFHETRNRAGQYGLGSRDETIARPTPHIMHNKLRLSYKERRSEFEEPIPPGADFARNGLNSGVQDLVHVDLKVRSEHTLCGKQYDGEMQLYFLHNYGNLEAVSILINADDGDGPNEHFQLLLDFFQKKFDADKRLCEKRRRRARALFADGDRRSRNDDGEDSARRLRGGSTSSSADRAALPTDDVEAEDDDEFQEEDEASEAPSSLAGVLYQNIQHRLLSLVHRQTKELRWDPLKPWDIYKSVHFWAYSGSTTEPPCFEDVKWRIVDVPMTISMVQYYQLKRLMFDHVDPTSCRKTSTHFDESNARPVQPYRGGATYRCRRSDYASDQERTASGRRRGFVLESKWRGVDMLPYVTPEFPDV